MSAARLSLPRHCKMRWLGLGKISGYSQHLQQFEAPRPVAIACFYIAVFLFFDMAWDYCSPMLYPGRQVTCLSHVSHVTSFAMVIRSRQLSGEDPVGTGRRTDREERGRREVSLRYFLWLELSATDTCRLSDRAPKRRKVEESQVLFNLQTGRDSL